MANSVSDWSRIQTSLIRNMIERGASRQLALWLVEHMDFDALTTLFERTNKNNVRFSGAEIKIIDRAGQGTVKIDLSTDEVEWTINGVSGKSQNIYDPFVENFML